MAVPLTNSYDSNVYNITESQATGKIENTIFLPLFFSLLLMHVLNVDQLKWIEKKSRVRVRVTCTRHVYFVEITLLFIVVYMYLVYIVVVKISGLVGSCRCFRAISFTWIPKVCQWAVVVTPPFPIWIKCEPFILNATILNYLRNRVLSAIILK